MKDRKRIKTCSCMLLAVLTLVILYVENSIMKKTNLYQHEEQPESRANEFAQSNNSLAIRSAVSTASKTESQLCFIMHIGPPKTSTIPEDEINIDLLTEYFFSQNRHDVNLMWIVIFKKGETASSKH